jgi:hypothetical protein
VELNKVKSLSEFVYEQFSLSLSLSLSLCSLRDEDISGFKRLCFLLFNLHGCQDPKYFGLKRILNTQGDEEEEGRKQIASSEYTDILLTVCHGNECIGERVQLSHLIQHHLLRVPTCVFALDHQFSFLFFEVKDMLVYTTNPLAIERLFKVSNNFENCRVQ